MKVFKNLYIPGGFRHFCLFVMNQTGLKHCSYLSLSLRWADRKKNWETQQIHSAHKLWKCLFYLTRKWAGLFLMF